MFKPITHFLEQNLEELIVEVYGPKKLEECKQSFNNTHQIVENIEHFCIHIDTYIVGGLKVSKQICCSGICTPNAMLHNMVPPNIFSKMSFEQLSKLKIHCIYNSELSIQLKKKIIDSIITPGRYIVIE